MRAATLKLFERVHSWAGLLAGLALFVAFYAGAMTMFHEHIEQWQTSHVTPHKQESAATAQALLESVTAESAEARKEIGVGIPEDGHGEVVAYWFDGKKWQSRSAAQMTLANTTESSAASAGEGTDLAHFLYELHYALAIPEVGIYLMGIVSVIYALALITGVILYLPGLTHNLFALRAGRNLKRLWQDAHNVIGVLSLPFHIIFAVTGAIFCLSAAMVAIFNFLVFKGELTGAMDRVTGLAERSDPRGVHATMLSPQAIVDRARAAVRERGGAPFDPNYVRYRNYGDQAATAEVFGNSEGALASFGGLAISAADGRVLNVQAADARDTNHASYSLMYGLHFGDFGHLTVRLLYFVLGLAGAFLFYSGNLLWIESRRNRRTSTQGRSSYVMARVTIAVCIGTCVGISADFIATLIVDALSAKSNGVVAPVFWAVLAACAVWSIIRAPGRAAAELLGAAAVLTIAIPVLDLALTLAGMRQPLVSPRLTVGTAALAIGLSLGFALLARATAQRARTGDVNSVWTATTRRTPSTAGQPEASSIASP